MKIENGTKYRGKIWFYPDEWAKRKANNDQVSKIKWSDKNFDVGDEVIAYETTEICITPLGPCTISETHGKYAENGSVAQIGGSKILVKS